MIGMPVIGLCGHTSNKDATRYPDGHMYYGRGEKKFGVSLGALSACVQVNLRAYAGASHRWASPKPVPASQPALAFRKSVTTTDCQLLIADN